MASIKTSLSLQDQMSAPMRKITESVNSMRSAWDRLSDSTSDGLRNDLMDEFRNDIQRINSSIDEMNEKINQFDERLKISHSSASALSRKLASIAAGIGFTKISTDAINFASDLTEVQNVVDVSFGDMSSVIDEWATTTLDAFGLNELSAKQFAGTMGAMLKSSGLTGQAVADMSMNLTQLSGDMASFYNLSGEEAFAKIRAGISGETEPLKQLGINMSVANLEAYALAEGIEKPYEKMSQSEQIMLRYGYLMQATADAQNDFARTQDSFANQQKLLQENFKALTGEIASNALPVLSGFFQMLNSGMQFLSNNLEVVTPLLVGVIGILSAYAAVHMTLGAAQAFAAAKQWILNNAVLACPVFWIIAAIIALIAVVIAVANHIAKTGETATTAFGVITGGVNVVLQFFKNLGLGIANISLGIVSALNACGQNIIIAFQHPIEAVKGFFYSLLSTVLSVVASIAAALNKLPFVEFDYSGLTQAAADYADKAQSINDELGYVDVGTAFKEGVSTYDAFSDGWAKEAYKSGAAWGDEKWTAFKSKFNKEDTTDIPSAYDFAGLNAEDFGSNMEETAKNTGACANALETSEEHLKLLRDIAERDVINRFTTAEVKVDFGSINNTINNNVDLDGVVDYIATSVTEALEITAEGVYA